MEFEYIISICCCILVISISIGVFFMMSNGQTKEPLVPGFYGADFGPNNMSGQETAESCLKWAQDNKYPVYGYRNETHPDQPWKKTCFSYTKTNVYAGNPADTVHSVGCTDTSKSVLKGCV